MLTLGETLDRSAIAFPDKEVICFLSKDDKRITYAELNERVNRLAGGLVKLGIKAGDKVALWMPNRPEWIVTFFAVARIGAVLVPMDTWYKSSEAEYILNHSDSVAVITLKKFGKSEFINMLSEVRPRLPKLKHIIVVDEVVENTVLYQSVIGMGNDWRENQEYTDRRFQNDLDNVVFIVYTSGTTGKPKGAMLSHMNIVANAKDAASIMQVNHKDRFLVPVPFSHLFGCVLGIAFTIVHGASIVVMETFGPEDVLKAIEKEKCTVCHGVPTMFIRELEVLSVRKYDVSSLRTGIIAGAPCPVDTMHGIMNVMKCNICIGYGLTECSLVTLTRFDDILQQRVETVGRALPNVEVKIVDDDHKPVPKGETGELACKGYNVMKGYYKMPEQTAEAIDKKGWLYTGDLATVDENKYYKIVGRKKDMVIVGGFNVYPREIEEYLISDPKIQQVAVLGVPDHDMGELIAVVIVPELRVKITGQEIVDLCYGKMASAKVPRYVFLEKELPISSRGKVQKYKLRKKLAERIEKERIKKIVPSEVKMKRKKDTLETVIDKLMATGKFNIEQKGEMEKFLLSLNEEQDKLFQKLVLDKNKVLKIKK
ncbi:MAG: AMP-binding protein [Thermoplasmatales archaeon]|nr:MAG: AMP-binding protein [Thermoplasmatales archaeon]